MGNSITYNTLLLVALGFGFAGARNIGVVIDFLFAPKIAEI